MNQHTGAVQRIGVFGGAFDPPHTGHFALAQAAAAQLQLDSLHIIPTGHAWHKTRVLTPAVHRLAMAALAFEGIPNSIIDARETQRAGPTYTVDTLQELHTEFPAAQLFLLLGEDQAQVLTSWRRWEKISDLATICVAARADSTGVRGQFDPLTAIFPGMRFLQMAPVPISATEIRHAATANQDLVPMVFESVARYIDNHNLYQST